MCVKFYFNRVCITNKNFQLFIKLLLIISFFAKFFVLVGSLEITDIFIPSIEFPLNYHQQNCIYAFLVRQNFSYRWDYF